MSDSIKPFLLAIASARSVFGSLNNREEYHAWSQWVNVHCLPRFGGQGKFQIEVIGRNARGETWAQPIDYPKTEDFDNQASVVIDEGRMMQRELPKNVEQIRKEAAGVVLFDAPDSEAQYEPDEKTIFRFQNFEIRAPKENPHVEEGGLHLWIHAHTQQNIEGVQSDIKHGVEQFIVAEAVAKAIYQELGVPIEIHFSGNWGLPAKGHWKESLSAHANLYGRPRGEENVELPPRPDYQRPEIPEETRQKTKEALEKHMLEYLDEFINFKLGSLEAAAHETQS